MAGQFSKGNLPKRPGAYFNFVARKPEPALAGSIGTVGIVAQHTWGPDNQVVALNNWGEFLATYGAGLSVQSNVTGGYRAVRDAFKGEGLPGLAGAGQVLFYRVANGAVAASKALQNTTPANAITLTARYKGTYGNQITVTSIANTADPTNKSDLIIYVEGSEVERYTYAKTNITDLAAQINGTAPYTTAIASDWVTAGSVVSGTALTAITQTALTGGTDGAALTPTDYSTAQTAFEVWRYSVFTIENLTDPTVQAALVTWTQLRNSKGRRFVTVLGGATGETMASAVARSATANDPNIVNVGGGTYTDSFYGDVSTAQLTPRIAGIIAQRGESAEVTFARFADLTIKVGVSDADVLTALGGGVIAISRDSHPTAPVRLELGVTTFTTLTDANRSQTIFGNLKFVRVMGGIETELTEWAEWNVIGKAPVNDATRDFIRGHIEASLQAREEGQIIQPGWSAQISANPAPSPTDTWISVDYTVTLARGLEQVLNTVTVG